MLGGGTFVTQNKVLPGAYINFVSAASASATLSDRGFVAFPLILDWGKDGEVFTVTQEDFQKNSLKLFGYAYTSEKLKGLRDLFKYAQTCYFYKLNGGVKAANTYVTAKYKGVRGNSLKTVIAVNADDNNKFDVATYLDTTLVDAQTVATAAELVSNDYVDPIKTATLAVTAGTPLTGGTNGEAVTGTDYQTFLTKIESYSFNILACPSDVSTVIALFVAFTKRMRDEIGVKFQTVVYRTVADFEGVINLKNAITDVTEDFPAYSLIYWLAGREAACAVNKDLTNKIYDGEFTVDTNYSQLSLVAGINAGELIFHKVGDTVRILNDINSFTTVTGEKSKDFSSNQVVRVLDQVGNDIAAVFNVKYLGNIQNNKAGRLSLWGDIVTYLNELVNLGAIEEYDTGDITVSAGNAKDSVVVECPITPVSAMKKLYMVVNVN
ncbi:phage tail sheath family protein [Anaerocolumna jejuensis]|uniref:phage tail sheath family protein n=1 Tax=Anaerocolumna jejuensis TaxID=259063 RepID=UPI003F7C7B11